MDKEEKLALDYLSPQMRRSVVNTLSTLNKPINEIRLREGKNVHLITGRSNVKVDYLCTEADISYTISGLCQGSLYSYADNIREGVIATDCGIRAGICGRAVVEDGRIGCVRDITSINIRIPHRVYGVANALYELVIDCGSVLLYSKPGLGKTTLLRELIPLLSSGQNPYQVAVIDTRFELTGCIEEYETADVFLGYPRKEGIISAVRTMSPDYVICDEISTPDDANSIKYACSSGVKIVASTHANSYSDLLRNDRIRDIVESGVFGGLYGITENGIEIKRLNE